MNINKALFLDRDGVINIDKKYLYKIEDFEFVDGIFELCKFFQERNYLIFVVTNQAGIARGYYSEDDFKKLTKWMIKTFKNRGINIQKVFHCPHHPLLSGECKCRKPKPEMIIKAKNLYNINLSKSVLIGDKKSDIKAGESAGIIKNYLIKSTYQKKFDFEDLKKLIIYLKGKE